MASRLVRINEVMKRVGISKSTIYLYMERGEFPRPVPVGKRSVAWVESEIDEYIAARIAEGRGSREFTGVSR